jgi:hypothetical protein
LKCLTNLQEALVIRLGCPGNKQKKFSVRTETNRHSICFGLFSVCFAKPINYFFGLFRFVSVVRIHIETTETNGSVSKQTKKIKIKMRENKLNYKNSASNKTFILNCVHLVQPPILVTANLKIYYQYIDFYEFKNYVLVLIITASGTKIP